jgi:hypothetical protein
MPKAEERVRGIRTEVCRRIADEKVVNESEKKGVGGLRVPFQLPLVLDLELAFLKLGGTKSDLAHDLKKGIVTLKVKVFDDDDSVMPELVEASVSDDDDDGDMPS